MQRPAYSNPPPAHSPPLHHPVPQHVSTVPQLRSPPPPVPPSQPQSGYGYAQQQQAAPGAGGPGGGYMHPGFGGFMNDPTAQMGFQVGKSAVMAGQEYMEQNFGRFVSVSALKHYFNVSNSYVVNKLYIVLFPWWHRPWSRQQRLSNNGQDGYYLPPREDINSPDMYIPMMALVTYILLSTLLAGLRGAFHPELLGSTTVAATLVILLEILIIKLGTFILNISSSSQILDLIAYSGYKFAGVIISLLLSELLGHMGVGGTWVSWVVFLYCFGANAFFLLRSLRYVLLPDQGGQGVGGGAAGYTVARSQRNRRTQFLFVYSYVVQFGFMLWLSKV
ncbi:YIF1-domain-containing protein [Lindgomyces ingoldianus]|uniref:YIF1-domain-containing protein n=1 Tax=Lindgomyces ingoldianus TaxID=673940 RepID=A0ACB6QIL4_9PLEO|nr:YIF1-domain-containing protein [Lindgomyces ingoldianus]KAF2465981.1 YIF1-domain-containing protein [Lindgomyces ingoldianus]